MTHPSSDTDRIGLAALDNARWCDTVCRSHGVVGDTDEQAWTSPLRTPPYYPDVVTLSPDAEEYALLARVDASDGCSVKDSFAALDLSMEDFARLVEGEWLWHDSPAARTGDDRRWHRVTTPDAMHAWVTAWAPDPEDHRILLPSLLEQPGVVVLAGTDGDHDDVLAGAIVTVGESVAGLGNFFSRDGDEARTWLAAVAAAREVVGGIPLVGWEAGASLAAAEAAGCERLGPLTVWMR